MKNQKNKKAKQEVMGSDAEVETTLRSTSPELRLVAMVLATVWGALLVRWGYARWLKTEGFIAGLIAWGLFAFGTGGLVNVTRILRQMVTKLKSQSLQAIGSNISTRLFVCSIVVVLALFFPAYWLSDIFEIGWSCWWKGFFNTFVACHAFITGVLVYYNAYVGVELLWVVFYKIFKKQ